MISRIKRELKLMNKMDGRQTWLDMARGVAIILVVMGHGGYISPLTNTWLSSFHLPLFFIASGILFELKNERNVEKSRFVIRKLKSLLIPYFAFTAISICFYIYSAPSGPANLKSDVVNILIQTISLQGYSVMWFLPVILLSDLIIYFIYRKLPCHIMTAIMTALSFALYYIYKIFSPVMLSWECIGLRIITKVLIAATFICLGIVIRRLSTNVLAGIKMPKLVGFMAGLALSAINIFVVRYICLKDLNNLALGYLSVYYLLGVTGSCGLFLMCKNGFNIPLLSYYGRNSIIIFCTHLNCYVLFVAIKIYEILQAKCNFILVIINEYTTANIFILIFTFILEIPVIVAINALFPFLIGKRYGGAIKEYEAQ